MQAVTNGYISQQRTNEYPRGPVEISGFYFYFKNDTSTRAIVDALLEKQLEFVRSTIEGARYNKNGELVIRIKNRSRLGSKWESRICPSLSKKDLENIVAKL